MLLTVNGKEVEVPDKELFIPEILSHQSIHDHKGLAVAINNAIVPREQWSVSSIKENDKIVIIRATQGG